jgi:glycosyltransferase involved in cell wall biosynthesis
LPRQTAKDICPLSKRQVKVLYVVTAYPRHSGDVITPWLTETIRRLARIGIEVEVLAPAYRGSTDQTVDGVRVHRFRYGPSRWEALTHDQTAPDRLRERPWYLVLVPPYIFSGCAKARRLAFSGGFDVVHVFWPIPHGLLGIAAKRATGIPLVSTFFGVELTWLRSRIRVLEPVLRWIVKRSDAVTAISTYTARELRGLAPGTELEIIPFGAANEGVPFPAGARGLEAKAAFELLFVGRLVERKGVQHLLRAVALLRDRGREVVLNVVGDGPYGSSLRALTAELALESRVRFHGQVAQPVLADRLAACDVLVLPAVRDAKGDVEGLGVVLIEALRAERPVIASDVGGIPDIVRDGETGLLVPPGDAERLAEAIERYAEEPELAAMHAAAGRRDVEERFSWDSIIRRLSELYHELSMKSR